MDIRKLQRAIVDGLEDVKAQHIVVFDTEALSPLFERVIIASGTSNRQTKALAASVRDAVKALGEPPPRTEGEDNGEWIIVDCGAAVAHIMQPSIRDYYRLEEIWGVKPVAQKKVAKTGLVKAEEPAAPARKTAAKKTAAKKAAPGRAPARKAPAKSPARKAVKATSRTASSTTAGQTARKAPVAKSAAGKSAAGKTAPRKAPAASKAAPAKKAPARKA
jgi:ribosome-associated protein